MNVEIVLMSAKSFDVERLLSAPMNTKDEGAHGPTASAIEAVESTDSSQP